MRVMANREMIGAFECGGAPAERLGPPRDGAIHHGEAAHFVGDESALARGREVGLRRRRSGRRPVERCEFGGGDVQACACHMMPSPAVKYWVGASGTLAKFPPVKP